MPTEPVVVEKPFYLKKRFYISLVAMIAIAIPAWAGQVEAYFGVAGTGYAFLNLILSLFSKELVIE